MLAHLITWWKTAAGQRPVDKAVAGDRADAAGGVRDLACQR